MSNIKIKFFGALDDNQYNINNLFSNLFITSIYFDFTTTDSSKLTLNTIGKNISLDPRDLNYISLENTYYHNYNMYLWEQTDFKINSEKCFLLKNVQYVTGTMNYNIKARNEYFLDYVNNMIELKFEFNFNSLLTDKTIKTDIKKLFLKSPRKYFII